MKIKDGVIMQGLHPIMRQVLKVADRIWQELGEELVVTSALDGEHSPGSWHYYGCALDFRTHYFTDHEKEKAFVLLTEAFPDSTVVLHTTHIHIQRVPEKWQKY